MFTDDSDDEDDLDWESLRTIKTFDKCKYYFST